MKGIDTTVNRLSENQLSLRFKSAKVKSVDGKTAKLVFEDGLNANVNLLDHINAKEVKGKEVEVLMEQGSIEFIYGVRLLDDYVIADSVEKHFDPQHNNFNVEEVRDTLYLA